MTVSSAPPVLTVEGVVGNTIEVSWTGAEALRRTGAMFEIEVCEDIVPPYPYNIIKFSVELDIVVLVGSGPYTCTLGQPDTIPGTISMSLSDPPIGDSDVLTDDGAGVLTGSISSGTINYRTGECTITGTGSFSVCEASYDAYTQVPRFDLAATPAINVSAAPISRRIVTGEPLESETFYYIRMRAMDSDGDGSWSAYVTATTGVAVIPPVPPAIPPRLITPTELGLMREHGQWSELFCAIDDPATVWTGKLNLNSLPASNDGVSEIEFTDWEWHGNYAVPAAGMTVLVGSAPGLSDVGVVRLRSHVIEVGTMKIGETSDVEWITDPQVDRYLTILDEFRVWPRLLRMEGPTDSANLTGLVSYASGDAHLYGGYNVAQECAAVNNYVAQYDTAVLYIYDSYPTFTTFFELNDWCFVKNGYGPFGGQLGYVVHVEATWIGINLPVLYPGTDPYVLVYPVKTLFSTEVEVGQTVTVTGGGAAEVVAITSNAELEVSSPWPGTISNAAYHTTTLLIYMDYDVPIEVDGFNQQYLTPSPPVVVMGGPIVIDNLAGNPIGVELDASDSYQIDGEVDSYAWQTTESAYFDAVDVADPTLTIELAGTYRVSCEVTPTVGNPAIGHRKIYVFDQDNPPFTLARLESCEGSVDGGGWTARLTVYGDASAIRDQVEVVLFARDHYGSTRIEIAQDTRRANVVMVGYVIGETITIDPELNTVTFDIAGPQIWLDKVMGVATAVEDTLLPPSLWTSMYALTIDRALWHLFVWRSTWTLGHDLYLTGDTRWIAFLEGKLGSLISQVDQMAKQVVLARAACDRHGRMIVELDPQTIPAISRATPIVQALTPADLRAPISLQRRTVNEVARVTVSGTSWNGTTATPYVSTKPGQVFRTHGSIDSLQNLALVDQDQCDLLARLVLANRNNPYPSVPLPLAGINRLLDIAPAMYVTVNLIDNSRGLALDSLPVLVKKLSYSYDPDTGEFTVDGEGEGYTDEMTRIEGAAPSYTPAPAPLSPTPTTALLDDFDRADEGPPPSSSWETQEGMLGLSVIDGKAHPTSEVQACGAIWKSSMSANSEAYATFYGIASLGAASYAEIVVRWKATDDFYSARISGTSGTPLIQLIGPGGPLASVYRSVSDGDSFAIRAIGNQITVSCKLAGSSQWVSLMNVIDDQNQTSGKIGLMIVADDDAVSFDDFGGGSV